MTEFNWDTIRTRAIRQLGETPNAPTEQDITQAFLENPRLVTNTVDAVIAEKHAGTTFRSAWAVIRYRTRTNPTEPIIATDTTEKQLRVRQAETFIRNAGLYLDREAELLSELFDEGRPLHPYRDQGLEERMTELWREQRPRGETAEHDQERRALERIELRAKLAAAREAARPLEAPEPETDPNWHEQPEPELAPERVGVR